jgi:hypothetical protein
MQSPQKSSVELLAWARISDQTEIQYSVCLGRVVELIIGGPPGLMLDTTEQGLENLLEVVSAALRAFREVYGPVSAA